ncbi:MAG: 16S rRNA (guanine(966)-N(2))-methyltransferase RsmD [Lachnospiraceae bacterium]|nr:16S rRNA (guanine(966)-N(2))-methyltransferase RsmD [Lachnospiraceae bacterium]
MRVIAGSARRLQLKTVNGMNTRPTTDRIKETLFNMLQNDIEGCSFLDLYSGSGAIGIEALSRGAKRAVFVEKNKEAIQCIKYNLQFTKLQEYGNVMENNVLTALEILNKKKEMFDIIFMDPPYNMEIEKETLSYISGLNIMNKYSIIIVEASIETDFSYASDMGYDIVKEKIYKTNKHVFLKKA